MELFQYILILLLSSLILISYFVYHRSFSATLVEMIAKFIQIKKIFNNKKIYDKYIKLKKNEKEKDYILPKFLFKSKIEEYKFGNFKTISLSNKNFSDTIILYLHGGSYIDEPLIFHWNFCDKICSLSNSKIIVPIYPLAPKHSWKEAYNMLLSVYKNILKEKAKNIIIMGDSAGGGLALGFCKYLAKIKVKVPDKLILISPWLDVKMQNQKIKKIDSKDPFLSIYALKTAGKLWANGTDRSDYKISPINGTLKGINNVYIFVGTREIFYPDVIKFKLLLEKEKKNYKVFIGKGLNHAYPLHPIKESKKTYKEIIELI